MTQIIQRYHVQLCILLWLSLLFEGTLSINNKDGFTMDLIPITSKHSPFYKANLTDSEIAEILNQFNRHDKFNLTTLVRPPISMHHQEIYTISLSIGTGRGKKTYNLLLSTGYGFMWIQCQPCHPCFQQSAPIFDPRLSPTFRPVGCADSLCRPPLFHCVNGKCMYYIGHATDDDDFVRGYLARESITIDNSQPIPMIPFGCAQESQMHFASNIIHGIVGMDMNPTSFVMQIAGQNSGVFSYCLVPATRPNARSFLRFGTDINQPRQYQTVPLLRFTDGGYHIHLHDISINGHHMNFAPGTFVRSPGNDGFNVDVGSMSLMISQAHTRVASYMRDYFQRLHVPVANNPNIPYNPCFQRVAGIKHHMPTMTLHFSGEINYDIRPEELFYYFARENIFCFGMKPHPHVTILGSRLQANKWMKIDNRRMLLSFAPQKCGQRS